MYRTNPSNYDKTPYVTVVGCPDLPFDGMAAIGRELQARIISFHQKKVVVVLDFYHGVFVDTLLKQLRGVIVFDHLLDVATTNQSEPYLDDQLRDFITDDRIFGYLSSHTMDLFFDQDQVKRLQKTILDIDEGIILVYGIGASYVIQGDLLIYADMARWEIQQRMRSCRVANWCTSNYALDYMRRYKRAYFIDWRVLDRHKQSCFDKMDYLLDTNQAEHPKMITAASYLQGLRQATTQPIRLVPFFDPGPWGGQWMKEVCHLDPDQPNYAWCFDGVPEENSLLLKYHDVVIEIPAINLVFSHPTALLGKKVYERFGKEFPIRFDFLDTMGGGNLSLQVHPTTEYIQTTFGMNYTQDESYYILDAGPDAKVYLGVKDGVRPSEMLHQLELANHGSAVFEADQYINSFPAKKHDHFLIPAGTIHCSGKNAMVLEVSSTPYLFTFKLWDWGRLGMDGLPRPIHLEHGKAVIKWNRTTAWVQNHLVNSVTTIQDSNGILEERTGLHELEFIETRRHWSDQKVSHHTDDGVHVLNLIEGEEAIIESPNNAFAPRIVHYAETFIIPAQVGRYSIRPHGQSVGKVIATLTAYVRT